MAAARKGIGVDGDTSSLEEVKKRGVEIADLTRDEKAAFAKATRPVFDKWAATIGADLVKKAEAAIAKTRVAARVVAPRATAGHARLSGDDVGGREAALWLNTIRPRCR